MKTLRYDRTLSQPLDSRQLRAFVALARAGGFTRAGKQLYLSQSAVSHSLKALETEIGTPLCVRAGKRVRLTPAGEHLLYYAERILAEMATAREGIERRAHWGKEGVRIGVGLGSSNCLLAPVIRRFREDFPRASILIETGDMRPLLDAVRERRLDAVVSPLTERIESESVQHLFTDEPQFVVPPEHPWTKLHRVSAEEIAGQEVLLGSRNSDLTRLLEKQFRSEGVPLRISLEIESFETLKKLVLEGLGVTVLPEWAVRHEVSSGALRMPPLGKKPLRRQWGIVTPGGPSSSLAIETFVRVCVELLPAAGAPRTGDRPHTNPAKSGTPRASEA